MVVLKLADNVPVGKMIIKPQVTTEERLKRICNFDVHRCPYCKKGRLVLIEVMLRIRSPEAGMIYIVMLPNVFPNP
jgi:hypothetical protein